MAAVVMLASQESRIEAYWQGTIVLARVAFAFP